MPPKADPYAAPLHRRIDTFLWIFSSRSRWSAGRSPASSPVSREGRVGGAGARGDGRVILAAVVFLPRRAVTRPRASYPFSVLSFSALGVRCSILDTGFTIHGSRGPVVV